MAMAIAIRSYLTIAIAWRYYSCDFIIATMAIVYSY